MEPSTHAERLRELWMFSLGKNAQGILSSTTYRAAENTIAKFLLGNVSERTRCNRWIATEGIMNPVPGKVSFTRLVKRWSGPSCRASILRVGQSSATPSLVQRGFISGLSILCAGDWTMGSPEAPHDLIYSH